VVQSTLKSLATARFEVEGSAEKSSTAEFNELSFGAIFTIIAQEMNEIDVVVLTRSNRGWVAQKWGGSKWVLGVTLGCD
jgi:hypothetical protein